MTSQEVIADTKDCGLRALMLIPFQTCSSVRTGVAPGGFTGLLAAKLDLVLMV